LDDDVLIAAISLEDDQLETLIKTYWSDVWNFIYVMTRNRSTSDDLTQETFIRAFRSLSAFRGESSYRNWLLQIARNLTINYRRSAFVRRMVFLDAPYLLKTASSAESEFLRQQHITDIWHQVLHLPAKFREVLVLDAKYDLSIQEMANLLHVPEGTIKSRLSRARARMTNWLRGEKEHD